MAAKTSRDYTFTPFQVRGLLGLLRAVTIVAGSVARQGVIEQLRATVDSWEKDPKLEGDSHARTVKYTFDREQVGALKLAFIELWSSQVANGATREVLFSLAGSKGLGIWEAHILPNLPKDKNIEIDLGEGDLLDGKVEEPEGKPDAPIVQNPSGPIEEQQGGAP